MNRESCWLFFMWKYWYLHIMSLLNKNFPLAVLNRFTHTHSLSLSDTLYCLHPNNIAQYHWKKNTLKGPVLRYIIKFIQLSIMANTDTPTKCTLCWAYKDEYFNFQQIWEKVTQTILKTKEHKIYFSSY